MNQSAGYFLDVDIQAVVKSIPRAIPGWHGDKNEAPDFEWWTVIWEEAATAEDGDLAGASGAQPANDRDQGVVSLDLSLYIHRCHFFSFFIFIYFSCFSALFSNCKFCRPLSHFVMWDNRINISYFLPLLMFCNAFIR